MRVKTRSSGYVKWPTALDDDGAGGIWVLAVWLSGPQDHGLALLGPEGAIETPSDPFLAGQQLPGSVALPLCGRVLSPNATTVYPAQRAVPAPTGRHADERDYLRYVLDAGHPVLGALCLGAYAGSPVHPDGRAWWAQRRHLTWRGRSLLNRLDTLYRRRSELVTHLDT